MKKGVKITLISVGSLLGLCLIAIAIVLILIFTPARLTAIVKKQIPKFITCQTELDRVELTFFKTFPQVGIDLKGLTFINPTAGAPSDTLLHVQDGIASVNIRKLMKEKDIDVEKLILKNGKARIFIDTAGNNNFDIFKTNSKSDSEFDYTINLRKIETKHIDLIYKDLKSKIDVNTNITDLGVKGKYRKNFIKGNVDLKTKYFAFNTLDSNLIAINGNEIKLHVNGLMTGKDSIDGRIKLDLQQLGVNQDTTNYLPGNKVKIHGDLAANLTDQIVNLKNTLLSLDDYEITLDGNAKRNPENGNMAFDLQYESGDIQLAPLLALINPITNNALNDITLDGQATLSGNITGNYNETEFPIVMADIDLKDGLFAMKDFPLDFQKINALLGLKLDIKNSTDVYVKSLNCYSGRNHLLANGNLQNLLGKTHCNLHVNGDLNLGDFKDLMPEKMNKLLGQAQADLQVKFYLDEIQKLNLDHATASGDIKLTNFDFLYNDTLAIQSPNMAVNLHYPASKKPYNINEWLEASIEADEWKGMKADLGHFSGKGTKLHAFTNDLTDSTISFKMGIEYDIADLQGKLMDSIDVHLQKPNGKFVMGNSNNMALDYTGNQFEAKIGQDLSAHGDTLDIHAKTRYNENGKNTLLKLNPTAKINIAKGQVHVKQLPYPVELPTVKANLTNEDLLLHDVSVKLGNSAFKLTGTLKNFDQFLHKTGMLTGNLEFISDNTDLNQILALVDGFRAPDSLKVVEIADEEREEDDPFIVPRDMNVKLHTLIKQARIEETDIKNIEGHVTVNDGILVLEEMGFTNEATEMQLTAMYKTPRRNHLFLGFDLHLLDIKIDKLIDMIPQIDTIVPMLKGFAGNAEFHLAAETYMKSNYDFKYSTLRGAAALRGYDLVILDNETYRTLAKKLMFNKKTENVIDSVSAEMTVYKNEVDVYPFLASMDKYQAILSGRHNLDKTFDYNISVIKPIRLGLDVVGKPGNLKLKLKKVKYPTLFKPEKRNVVEENVLRLKEQIYQSLKANVKEH